MSADPNLHVEFDAALERVKGTLGRDYPMFIGGVPVNASEQFDDRSPIDTRILLGRFQGGGREHVQQAIAAARAAYPAWSGLPWQERVRLLKKVADTIRTHQYDLSALMGYEVGKNRLECLGDVVETADLIEYYCDEYAKHSAYTLPMGTLGPDERNQSVLRPYGVFAVIAPFNFPMALAGGPAGAAARLGMKRTTLQSKMAKLGIDRPAAR
jgi:1-pyrroline-5-carboxylate dehydrogenase